MFDRYRSCAFDGEQKKKFHRQTRTALRALAKELRFSKSLYDLRSNEGGIAVSGEITLHHERVYIQVSQPATGADSGVLIRACGGRRDYTGGRSHFATLSLLDAPKALAEYVRAVMSEDLSRVSHLFGPLAVKRSAFG